MRVARKYIVKSTTILFESFLRVYAAGGAVLKLAVVRLGKGHSTIIASK